MCYTVFKLGGIVALRNTTYRDLHS